MSKIVFSDISFSKEDYEKTGIGELYEPNLEFPFQLLDVRVRRNINAVRLF